MLRVVTSRKTKKIMIIGTRDYCAECETPLQTPNTTNGDYYCPQCKSVISEKEILAVRVCPLCNRNVWNFKKSGISEMCPHCKEEFVVRENTQPQPKRTTPRHCFSIFYP